LLGGEKCAGPLFHRPPSRGAGDLGSDAGAVVAFGDRKIVAGRQVYPEPGAGAEKASLSPVSALTARLPFRIDVIRPEAPRA
jgi:hypothetical protein